VPNAEKITQFRPIGLCNVVYKLITKCIVNRLKGVLPDMISPVQSSFVPGRQITDNVIIMQEVLHSMRRKTGAMGLMAIKLDLEKAYDRLRWDFLHSTLLKMQLPDLLIRTIMQCVSTCSLNILWNGEPSGAFTPSRGIRQGDPLSPYLFVSCMERLSQLIDSYSNLGKWKAISLTRGGTRLSHLMFADDVVLFGDASREQAYHIQACLQEFCEASGQKISATKSSIYFSPNTNEATRAEICNILRMQQTEDFGRYLGVPTINRRVTRSMFQGVIERVEQRLAGWKSKCLTLAGRITLIKSTLTAIPAYVMQTVRLPRSVCDGLDKRVRRFLWGGTGLERKPHLVSWDIVTREKTKGGLGIRNMRQLNSAFLMKLGWRWHSEPSALWVRLLKEKYTKGSDLITRMGQRQLSSNAWRGIVETMEMTTQGIGMAIGDGSRTDFWEHRWLDGKRLIEHTHHPISADSTLRRVRDFWDPNVGWDWARLTQYLPIEILQRIASYDLGSDEIEDSPMWTASRTGEFTISSAINILQGAVFATESPWNWLWKLRLPHRIQVFLWLLFHQKLLTNSERFRRKFGPDPLCGICLEEAEDLDHLLRKCPHAQGVWQSLNSLGLCCVNPDSSISDWLRVNLTGSHVDPQWPRKFAISLWYLWKWRCTVCLGSMELIPFDRGAFLQQKFQEIIRIFDEPEQGRNMAGQGLAERWIRWEPPERGWWVLNADGAVRGALGLAGAGGVVRGYQGKWVVGFSEPLGRCSVTQAELRAVLRGLRIAKEAGIRKLWVQVDSKVVETLLTIPRLRSSEYNGIIQQCKILIDRADWEVRITHCFREANQVADKLANMGLEGQLGVKLYHAPPEVVRGALLSDQMGVAWPRQFRVQ